MKIIFIITIYITVFFAGLSVAVAVPPAGEKDGLKLYIHFKQPLDNQAPKIRCELENKTGNPLIYQGQGSWGRAPMVIQLIDENGKEIEKNADWLDGNETGVEFMRLHQGVFLEGGPYLALEIDLNEAFGSRWKSAVRLDAIWNMHETRTGPGPNGGDWGVGRGLSGSFDVTPLTGKKFIPRPPQSEIPPPVEQAPSQDPAPFIPSESTPPASTSELAPPPSSEAPPSNIKSPQNIESKSPSPDYRLPSWLFQSLVIALLVRILVQIKRSKK